MTEKTAKSVNNLGYHAHIYYDPTRTRAPTCWSFSNLTSSRRWSPT